MAKEFWRLAREEQFGDRDEEIEWAGRYNVEEADEGGQCRGQCEEPLRVLVQGGLGVRSGRGHAGRLLPTTSIPCCWTPGGNVQRAGRKWNETDARRMHSAVTVQSRGRLVPETEMGGVRDIEPGAEVTC